MGIFGDRDVKRLTKVLDECRSVVKMSGNRGLPAEMSVKGLNNASQRLADAAQMLVDNGQRQEARKLLETARATPGGTPEGLWKQLLDPLIEQL